MLRGMMIAILLLMMPPVLASDITVQARVISTTAVYGLETETGTESRMAPRVISTMPRCPVKPVPEEGLVSLLGWDLGLCTMSTPDRARRTIAHYRVAFEWQGETGEVIMDEPPDGRWLPMRVRLH
jgi:hypothetical protein